MATIEKIIAQKRFDVLANGVKSRWRQWDDTQHKYIINKMGQEWVDFVRSIAYNPISNTTTLKDQDARGCRFKGVRQFAHCDLERASIGASPDCLIQHSSLKRAEIRADRLTLQSCALEDTRITAHDLTVFDNCSGNVEVEANSDKVALLFLNSQQSSLKLHTDGCLIPIRRDVAMTYISYRAKDGELDRITSNWADVPIHIRKQYNPPKPLNIWSVGL